MWIVLDFCHVVESQKKETQEAKPPLAPSSTNQPPNSSKNNPSSVNGYLPMSVYYPTTPAAKMVPLNSNELGIF